MIQSLPLSLRDIASAIGEQKTLELVEAIGGQRVWIPLKPPPDWALFKILGNDAGRKLAALCGGNQIEIPVCKALKIEERNQQIREDRELLPIGELIAKYGLSRHRIYRICRVRKSL